MPQGLLDDTQLSPTSEEVGSETVPEDVGENPLPPNAGSTRCILHNVPDPPGREGFSRAVHKEEFGLREGGAPQFKILLQGLSCGFVERNNSFFPPLSSHPDCVLRKVYVFEPYPRSFAHPHTTCVEELKERPIPHPGEIPGVFVPFPFQSIKDLRDLLLGQKLGEFFLHAELPKPITGVLREETTATQEPEKAPKD